MTKTKSKADKLEIAATNEKSGQCRRAAQTRWSAAGDKCIAHAARHLGRRDGGHVRALVDRAHLAVLKSREPMTLEEMALVMKSSGNRRCDAFHAMDGEMRLAEILRHFIDAPSLERLKGLRSRWSLQFAHTKHTVLTCANEKSPRCGGRRHLLTLHPMYTLEDRLVPEDGTVPIPARRTRIVRLSVLEGGSRVTHACLRVKSLAAVAPATEDEVFDLASQHARTGQPEGVFVCDPQEASETPPPAVPVTAGPVDLVTSLAMLVVNMARALSKGSRVVVTLADFTGAVHPLELRQAVLKHPIKTQIVLSYLPCLGMHEKTAKAPAAR